ncbi:MAG TPA: PQQ-dependent sugar dehydrogenase [Gemmatimonadaceae bacterium]
MRESISQILSARRGLFAFFFVAGACGASTDNATSNGSLPPTDSTTAGPLCDANNGGITLPSGFCATVFADHVGTARHIAVSSSGDVYVMLSGGAVLALRDTNADGHADMRATFGRSGNSGLTLVGNDLYADIGSAIVRYKLTPGTLAAAGSVDTIVKGLPTGGHSSRSVAVDPSGNLFIGIGSATNMCEGSPPNNCSELPTRAGVWRFDANAVGQSFSTSARFATGIRNAVGMAIHPSTGKLYVTQHGRDNLFQLYPKLYSSGDGAESPGEELFQVDQDDDFGWPYCYYDRKTQKRVLTPEYGGDRNTVGRCASTRAALTTFPGHWAPNGLMFYTASQFPAHYKNGAFVAFHGSWNRTPLPQAGYLIAFVPASGSSLGNTYEVFASGFSGSSSLSSDTQASHRPTGLASDSSGALYITDDVGGRIWRVTYRGS